MRTGRCGGTIEHAMSPVVIGSFAALDAALVAQVAYALRDYQKRSCAAAASMARYVQKRASEMTADKATHTLDERGRRHSRGGGQGRAAQHQDSRRPPWHAKRSIAGTTLTTGCTLYLSGEEDEVVRPAAEHAVSVHGKSGAHADVGRRLRRCGHPRAHRPRASLNQRLDELRHPDPADRRRAELHQGGIRSRSAPGPGRAPLPVRPSRTRPAPARRAEPSRPDERPPSG